MGGNNWDRELYETRAEARIESGRSAFEYHETMTHAPVDQRKCHDLMNPRGVIRESRDSITHPESRAIGCFLDVTGSMAKVPQLVQELLKELMTMLIDAGIVEHPQILFGAVGDSRPDPNNHNRKDKAPLQVGQYESGIEMEDDLGRFYLEGGGGGTWAESYQNVLYFLGRKTSIDCFEKRGLKGYGFMFGDEMAYDSTTPEEAELLFGDALQADVPTTTMLAEAREKYHIFFFALNKTHNYFNAEIIAYWRDLLGDHYLRLDMPEAICETMALVIGLTEGKFNLEDGVELLRRTCTHATDEILNAAANAVRGYAMTLPNGVRTADMSGLQQTEQDNDRPRNRRLS